VAIVIARRNSARILAIWSKRPDATRLIDAELQGITAEVEAALERDGFVSSSQAVRRLVEDLLIDAGFRRRRVGLGRGKRSSIRRRQRVAPAAGNFPIPPTTEIPQMDCCLLLHSHR
jgi:hypothetical protein